MKTLKAPKVEHMNMMPTTETLKLQNYSITIITFKKINL